MRQAMLISLLLLAGYTLLGQETSVVVLKATTSESASDNDRLLRNELQGIIDQALGTTTYGSLGCRFRLEATSNQKISGMAKRTIVRYTFAITFLDYVLNFPVGEPVKGTISGSGNNAKQALTNALSKLRKTYLSPGKLSKVIADHRASLPECQALNSQLIELREQGHSTGVLAVSAQLAETSECATAVEQLVSDIYKQRQAADCRQRVIRAKAEVVAGNLPRAARLLAGVDPTLECADDVEATLDQLIEKGFVANNFQWYRSARRAPSLSPTTRRRIISNIVLEYAYQNY